MDIGNIERQCLECKSVIPSDAKVCPNCGAKQGGMSIEEIEKNTSTNESENKLVNFVIEEIRKGTDNIAISQKLVENGMDQNETSQFVEQLYVQVMKIAEEEKITAESYTLALMGAGLASILGGIIWGLIVIATNREIGFMAIGMGFLAGYAVVKLSKGKKGIPFQIIAVASSIIGMVIGKYISFYHFLREAVIKDYGIEMANKLNIFSFQYLEIFLNSLSSMLRGYDLVWVVLAIVTAWIIPQGLGIKKVNHI